MTNRNWGTEDMKLLNYDWGWHEPPRFSHLSPVMVPEMIAPPRFRQISGNPAGIFPDRYIYEPAHQLSRITAA